MDKHLCLLLSPTVRSKIPSRKHMVRCLLMVVMLCFPSQGLHLCRQIPNHLNSYLFLVIMCLGIISMQAAGFPQSIYYILHLLCSATHHHHQSSSKWRHKYCPLILPFTLFKVPFLLPDFLAF